MPYLFYSGHKAEGDVDDYRVFLLQRSEEQSVVGDCEGSADCAWIGERAQIADLEQSNRLKFRYQMDTDAFADTILFYQVIT